VSNAFEHFKEAEENHFTGDNQVKPGSNLGIDPSSFLSFFKALSRNSSTIARRLIDQFAMFFYCCDKIKAIHPQLI
jgi:hypothetical protein